jgi:translocation and assembly module TamB
VPASSVTSVGAIPDIRHVGSDREARVTRERAGLNPEPEPSAQSASPNAGLRLAIDINAPRRIFIRGRGLEAELGGNIELRGRTSRIISSGQFDLIRGRLDILGKRFDLVEGSAQFVGSTTPFIRFVTTASTRDGTASIIVEGEADEPEVTFESTPEAPEDEVIAQLLFNRSISELSALQALQLANAVAVLAGRSGIGLVGQLREGLGLDDFDVTTTDSGETAVRAGKYISENVYTDFTAAAGGESELSINLDLTESFKARGTVREDGNTGIGFAFERDY